jgi:glutamine synthetase type III
VHHAETEHDKARAARELRLETMVEARAPCDELEGEVPSELWTLAT